MGVDMLSWILAAISVFGACLSIRQALKSRRLCKEAESEWLKTKERLRQLVAQTNIDEPKYLKYQGYATRKRQPCALDPHGAGRFCFSGSLASQYDTAPRSTCSIPRA